MFPFFGSSGEPAMSANFELDCLQYRVFNKLLSISIRSCNSTDIFRRKESLLQLFAKTVNAWTHDMWPSIVEGNVNENLKHCIDEALRQSEAQSMSCGSFSVETLPPKSGIQGSTPCQGVNRNSRTMPTAIRAILFTSLSDLFTANSATIVGDGAAVPERNSRSGVR
jgi:hypothetical protein